MHCSMQSSASCMELTRLHGVKLRVSLCHYKVVNSVTYVKPARLIAVLIECRLDGKENAAVKCLLESLWFPEMNARRNTPSLQNHEGTLSWIFEDPLIQALDNDGSARGCPAPPQTAPGQAIRYWLGSNQQLFWVSGKAASGKSTLMRFLINDARTLHVLQEKQPDVLIISAFI
jgi:hypothetical protein